MSSRFVNYTPVPFAGLPPQGKLVNTCAPSKQLPPTTVPVILDWSKYPPGAAITINLQTGVFNPIDMIKSIVIDNLAQNGEIDVVFPDTGFTVSCPRQAIQSGAVFTFQLQVLVIQKGAPVAGMFTTIFFNNFLVDTYQQSEVPSAAALGLISSSVDHQQVYSPRALGSQHTKIQLSLSTIGASTPLFGGARLDGFIFVTSMHAQVIGSYSSTNAPIGMSVILEDNLGGQAFDWTWYATNDTTNYSSQLLMPNEDIQWLIDATKVWTVNNTAGLIPAAVINIHFFWDYVTV